MRHFYSTWRIWLASLSNVGLLIYWLSHPERLWNVRDFRYVQVSIWITWILAIVPTVVLLLLFPVMAHQRAMYRWLAIGLSTFPAYLAIAAWVQLLSVAFAGK